jgi:hypothetical protein
VLKIEEEDEPNPEETGLPVSVGSTVAVLLSPVGYGGADEVTEVLTPLETPEPEGLPEIPVSYGYVGYTGAELEAAGPLGTYVEFGGYLGVDDGLPVDKITLLEAPDDDGWVPSALDVATTVEFVLKGVEAPEFEDTPPERLPLAEMPVPDRYGEVNEAVPEDAAELVRDADNVVFVYGAPLVLEIPNAEDEAPPDGLLGEIPVVKGAVAAAEVLV